MDGGLTYTLSEDFIKETVNQIPTKRIGTPLEIANTIKFLVENEYVNGTTIKLTGGL
jgi:3-oxoacyl-[acyl-carrier protein] reductase